MSITFKMNTTAEVKRANLCIPISPFHNDPGINYIESQCPETNKKNIKSRTNSAITAIKT